MEENNALREAMRKLKLELSTTTAVLLAAEGLSILSITTAQ
jgi:hypothetical protein